MTKGFTLYYTVDHVGRWNYEEVDELVTIARRDGNKIGSIDVYPECEFGNSISSIISNIYGMHAYLKEDVTPEKNIANLAYCVVVGYEASAAEQIGNISPVLDELHYIFISDNQTIVDFCVENALADTEIITVMESIKLHYEEKTFVLDNNYNYVDVFFRSYEISVRAI